MSSVIPGSPPLRILYMGSSEFSIPTLESLARGPHRVVAVVTTPDQPQGRGMKSAPSPVKTRAEKLGLPLFQPDKLKDPDFIGLIARLSPALGVVASYGKILPDALLRLPPLGFINLHPSLLPKYRGAAPIQWTILNGDAETGVTAFLMDRLVDHGPILAQRRVEVKDAEEAPALHDRLARLGSELLAGTIDPFAAGSIRPSEQDDARATSAPKISKEDALIAWKDEAPKIERRLRAFQPWPGTHTHLDRKLLKILSATTRAHNVQADPGTVVGAGPSGIEVACGRGTLVIHEIQPESKKRMTAAEFVNGYRLKKSARFQ
ncbi:MAG: methionyl-tRNA formyltransferase [Nitrospirae bacterium]|nr:methionyl-tRNA formyltransferase [Nitrospirota bacterium]